MKGFTLRAESPSILFLGRLNAKETLFAGKGFGDQQKAYLREYLVSDITKSPRRNGT